MTDHPIVFVDCETTGLGRHARPWEIAVIRRDPGGAETHRIVQVTYTLHNLPQGTDRMALEVGGWLRRGCAGSDYIAKLRDGVDYADTHIDERAAAERVHSWFAGAPILVGVGVHFDAAVLGRLFHRHGLTPDEPWHYAILDLKAATWGHLRGQDAANDLTGTVMPPEVDLPLSSEPLAAILGVDPPTAGERHTALGDARWAARWYDALTGGAR